MTTSPASFASETLVERVRANLARVKERIASTGRDPGSVRIVGVTKTFGGEYVHAASLVGLAAVGENYVDELCAKRAESADALSWHFLGALQTNKIHRVLTCADVVCGVSRLKELEKIAQYDLVRRLYVQVDFTGAARRNGAPPEEVAQLVARGRELGLRVDGIMTVAPDDPAGARRAFQSTVDLADDLGLDERSMGMSDDLEIACELGSTEVRIGRAIFGTRISATPLA